MVQPLDIVILGLSVTSSWGNGHATTYRGLIRGLATRGHRILFLERDMPWYRENRDQPHNPFARTEIYQDVPELIARFEAEVSHADLVIVGSFVPQGIEVGQWVTSVARGITAFYDIDTPVTYGKLQSSTCDYVTADLISRYHMYLSFTGGPILQRIERQYASPMARVLYCSVDPTGYFPVDIAKRWDLGYLGTYSSDRQPALERLLLQPARQLPDRHFAVTGPMYPEDILWPPNVERTIHLDPAKHRNFYCAQRFTLNITRADMIAAGYSPSVRLFEAGACGVPVISDWWHGLDTLLQPGKEILLAETSEDVECYLAEVTPEARRAIGARARARVLAEHTPQQRALQLESYYGEAAAASGRALRTEHNYRAAADSTRRNGRGGEHHHGLAARRPAKRSRTATSDEPGEPALASSPARNLLKPSGKSNENCRGSGPPTQSGSSNL